MENEILSFEHRTDYLCVRFIWLANTLGIDSCGRTFLLRLACDMTIESHRFNVSHAIVIDCMKRYRVVMKRKDKFKDVYIELKLSPCKFMAAGPTLTAPSGYR